MSSAPDVRFSRSERDLEEVDLNESIEYDITFFKSGSKNISSQDDADNNRSHLIASDYGGDEADGDLGQTGVFDSTTGRSTASSYNSTNDGYTETTYTIEDAIEHLGYGRFQIRLSCIAGLAWTTDAMEMMVLSILSPALQCDWGLAKWELSLMTSVVFFGMLLGGGFWGSISDRYGRKMALILSAAVCMYYGVLSALSLNVIWLLIFRSLVGFGVVGGGQAVTLYSEFLPLKARAKSIVGLEVFWVLGSGFSTLLSYFVMPNLGWRWLLGFSAIPLVLFIVACQWMPESVRFELSRGHVNSAIKTLKECAAENKVNLPPGRLLPPPKQKRRGHISDLFTKNLRFTTLLLWYIWFANTFCYYGIVLLTTELLDIQGEDTCKAISSGHVGQVTCALDCRPLTPNNYLEILWTTAAELPGLLLTFLIIDVIGRKWSSFSQFMAFSLFTALVAICSGRLAMIVCLFCARGFIAGAFQVAFVYAPEVYPTNCRAIGLGVCNSLAKFGAVVTPFVAQVLLERSIYAAIGIYATVAALAGVASLLLPVETKGKQLQENH